MRRRSFFTLAHAHEGDSVTRAVASTLEAGGAGLWLTSYTKLSMAAQFSDELAADPRSSLRLPCAPGNYRVSLRERAGVSPPFELELTPADSPTPVQHNCVPWFEL